MFSHPNRERRFDWIRKAVSTHRFLGSYPDVDLELGDVGGDGVGGSASRLVENEIPQVGVDVIPTVRRGRSPSNVSSLSLLEPLLVCDGMKNGNQNDVAGRGEVNQDNKNTGGQAVRPSETSVGSNSGLKSRSFLGGLVVVQGDENLWRLFDGNERAHRSESNEGLDESADHQPGGGENVAVFEEIDLAGDDEPNSPEIAAGNDRQQLESYHVDENPSGAQGRVVGEHVVIDMEGMAPFSLNTVQVESDGPSKLLQRMYSSVGWTGVSWYIPGEDVSKLDWFWRCLRILIKIIFIFDISMSLLDSACQIKFGYYYSVSPAAGYQTFVEFAVGLVYFSMKIYGAYTLSVHQEKVENMLNCMRHYEIDCVTDPKIKRYSGKWKLRLVTFFAIASCACAATKPFLKTDEKTILARVLELSQNLAFDVFSWNSETITDDFVQMGQEYGSYPTRESLLLGSLGLLRDAASYWQMGIIILLVLVVCFVAYVLTMDFVVEVKSVTTNIPRERVMEWTQLQAHREHVWRKYRRLKDVFKTTNVVFDPVLKVMHVVNLLMYAYFMTLKVFYTYPWLFYALYAVNMVASESYYYLAGKIAEQNELIDTWIRNWGMYTGHIIVDGEEINVGVMLREIEKEPIGLGQGKFLIQPTLHYKFLGLVLSVFFSMTDEKRKA